MGHIKEHYYRSHITINPNGIVPMGPILDLDRPHGRGALGQGLTRE
jgi:putative glutathione S-transferase